METILSTLPSCDDAERMIVVLVQNAAEGNVLELRQQSFGEGIGWFTQSSVRLEPTQVAALRNTLGAGSRTQASLPREFNRVDRAAWQPRVLHADSA